MASIRLESLGRGLVVKGDTMNIKDFLKTLGGRWNKPQAGWMFPGSAKAKLLSELSAHGQVSHIDDQTAAGAPAGAPAAEAPQKRRAAEESHGDASSSQPSDSAAGSGAGDEVFQLPGSMRVSISSFGGSTGVDVRKYYKTGTGEMAPTPQGAKLKTDEWAALCKLFTKLDAMCKSTGQDDKIEVKGDLFASLIREGTAVKAIDVRTYYKDKSDGQQKPGKKGFRLTLEQWAALKGLAENISSHLAGESDKQVPVAKRSRVAAAAETAEVAASSSGTAAAALLDSNRLKEVLGTVLEGRELEQLSLRVVREELEVKLGLEKGALDGRREEIKGIVVDHVQRQQGQK